MTMKKLFTFLFILIPLSITIIPQNLPNYMTEQEKILWNSYIPPVNPDYTTPPPTPVRTMAEWEELQGIMITWTSYLSILRQIVDYAQEEGLVYIVCTDSNSVKSYLTQGGVPLYNLRFLITSFNTIWCRDYGPWSVYAGMSDTLEIIDWIYNRPRPQDDVIPIFVANYLNVPIYQTTVPPYDLINTGGNFMTDGNGTAFASNLILDENPGHTEAEIDTIMSLYMGINRYIKMNTLPYDVIHHIDMHMKLLDEETILVGQYPPGVADGPQIEANLQYIKDNFLTCYGRPYRIVRIPMPPDANGHYPDQGGDYRTYTNSVIINKSVIIPTYEYQYDTTAFRIYREAMPGYNIIGIDCNAIIPALGAIHCITKEIGSFDPIFISHARIEDTVFTQGPFEIDAFIKTRSGVASAEVNWTIDTSLGYAPANMSLISENNYTGLIPAQQPGDVVYYYITVQANDGKIVSKPLTAPYGYYKFKVDESVPVELVNFTAEINGDYVTLKWQSETEANNKGFEIEKLKDYKIKRSPVWENMGFVEGNGTTTQLHEYSFVDKNVPSGKYQYRLKQIDFNGSFKYSNVVEVNVISPLQFSLEQNYPNPFNPTTTISWRTPVSSWQTLKVYDVLGREVATLVNEFKPVGKYKVEFNANGLPSGIYFYKLETNLHTASRKMILMK
jgi:agmatine deiminase